MKQIFLIRHAKSSWKNPDLDDFDRPLNKRGKRNAPEMARRLAVQGIVPDRIVSSPAKRARKTAVQLAKGTGYSKERIVYRDDLYHGSIRCYVKTIKRHLQDVDRLFIVGHNCTLTDLACYLSGSYFENIPTAGIVALECVEKKRFRGKEGGCRVLFFDFPRNRFP